METQMKMEVEMERVMEVVLHGVARASWEVIFGAREVSRELRSASERLLALDFEALVVSGGPEGYEESPKKLPSRHPETPRRLIGSAFGVFGGPRSTQESPQATILDTFIFFRASKSVPRSPQVTIYRLCRRFRASVRGTGPLDYRLGRT